MRIGLIIADFEQSYTSSFQHTARVKYGVDFNSSNVDKMKVKLDELKTKLVSNQAAPVHVGYEITLADVQHVENLFNQIIDRYSADFSDRRPNRKIYDIIQKLRDASTPTAKDLAKEVVTAVLTPEQPAKLTKKQKINAEAEKLSKQRILGTIKKNSAKT